jgi:putative transposase
MIARHVKLKMNRKLRKELEGSLWHLTGCYNWVIKTIDLRKSQGLPYSEFDVLNLISGHSKKCGVSSRALAGTVNDAFGAWQKCWSKQNGRPRLKGARNLLTSIQFRGDCKLYPDTNQIRLPNLGKVRYQALTCGLPEAKLASTVRLIKKASGWYAVLLFETDHKQVVLATNTRIGIDTGFKNLIVTSDGQKFDHPRELEKSLKQLAKTQRGHSKQRAARLHEKIANQRKDRNHKISHDLVRDHAEIYITNDNLRAQARRFGKSIASSGIGQLRQFVLYKGSSCRRVVELVESKYSTVTCSVCRSLTGPTGLSKLNIRFWECPVCGTGLDRDINAAVNTLNAGARYALEASKEAAPKTSEEVSVAVEKVWALKSKNCLGRAVS